MDGIINLNKLPGITSAKSLYQVRSITHQRKSGHAGTLDPRATGVLVICLGKATKLVEQIMNHRKVYAATARLDVTSSSLDSDSPLSPVSVPEAPSEDRIRDACRNFEGVIRQVPPVVSAIKVGGRPAYDYARRSEPVELPARTVTVYWIRVRRYDWPVLQFDMCCGRGTYVRAFVRDLGERVNTGGCLTSLRRTRVGPFAIEDAWTIEQLRTASPADYVVNLETARAKIECVPLPSGGVGIGCRPDTARGQWDTRVLECDRETGDGVR